MTRLYRLLGVALVAPIVYFIFSGIRSFFSYDGHYTYCYVEMDEGSSYLRGHREFPRVDSYILVVHGANEAVDEASRLHCPLR